jgi:hypothetical protein
MLINSIFQLLTELQQISYFLFVLMEVTKRLEKSPLHVNKLIIVEFLESENRFVC